MTIRSDMPSTGSTNTNLSELPESGNNTEPDIYVQIQQLLEQTEQAANAPFRMLAVAKLMAVIYRWNATQAGTPLTWDKEPNLAYKQQVIYHLLEVAARNLTEFAQSSGVMVGEGEETALADETDEPGPAQKLATWLAALHPEPIIGRKGKALRGGGTVAGNRRAIEFIDLLRRSGGLTRDQLRFLAAFNRPQGAAAQHETSETITLLVSSGFATPHECNTWKNSQAELYSLSETGETFYSLTHQRDQGQFQWQSAYQRDANLQHIYAVGQVLASIAGTCRVATSAAKLAQLENSRAVSKAMETDEEGEESGPALRLDWETSGYDLTLRDNQTIYPDAAGRILLNEAKLAPELLNRANLSPERNDQNFAPSPMEGVVVWPFVMEYLSSHDTYEQIAHKIVGYTELYNQSRSWPDKWCDRYPVVLIVVEGGVPQMLNLMMQTRNGIRRVLKPRQPRQWWFTTTGWFSAAYADFIGTFNNRRKPRETVSLDTLANYNGPAYRVAPAEHGRIWLPLFNLPSEPPPNFAQRLNEIDYLIRRPSATGLKVLPDPTDPELAALLDRFTALPLPH